MADQGGVTSWPVEVIPDTDSLFMRVHRTWIKADGTIAAGVFQNRGSGMSTDWAKYSSPTQTRSRGRKPGENAVVSMIVGQVRQVPGQSVQHRPLIENRAHTEVEGPKDEEVRVRLRRLAGLVLILAT